MSSWTTYHKPLGLHSFQLLMVTLWWSLPLYMSIVSLEPHSISTFLLVLLSYSSFSGTYYSLLHIFPHLLLFPATSSFLSPTLLSFTFLYILLLVHYNVVRLSLLSVLHSLTHIPFLSLIPSLPLSATPLLSTLLLLSSLSSLLL